MQQVESELLFPPFPAEVTPRLIKQIRRWRSSTLTRPSLNRFLHPYYLFQLALILLYFPTRQFLLPIVNQSVKGMEWDPESREIQMFLILSVLLFTKYRRSNSWETFLNLYVIRYTKLAILASAFVVDGRLCTWFFVIYGVTLLVGPKEPEYSGPTNVKKASGTYHGTLIDNPNADPNVTYIVCLTSKLVDTCMWFQSEFAATSLLYGYKGSSVVFAEVSLDDNPNLVDKYQLLTPQMNRFEHELPTVLMFQGGKVLARLPEVGKKTMMDATNLNRGLDLENRARLDSEVMKSLLEKAKGDTKQDKKKTN